MSPKHKVAKIASHFLIFVDMVCAVEILISNVVSPDVVQNLVVPNCNRRHTIPPRLLAKEVNDTVCPLSKQNSKALCLVSIDVSQRASLGAS